MDHASKKAQYTTQLDSIAPVVAWDLADVSTALCPCVLARTSLLNDRQRSLSVTRLKNSNVVL